MKRNILSSLLLVAGMVVVSCHAKKQLVRTTGKDSAAVAENNAANTKHKKLEAIRARQVSFNTFSGKAKTQLDINGNSNDVTLNIRIQRNQRIWISVTAVLGVEVARAMITQDSILVLNRLQSQYLKKPFSYVHSYTGPAVNYKTIESILVGNAIPELLNDDAQLNASNNNTVLTGQLAQMMYELTVGPDLKVSSTNLSNQAAGQSLMINNSDYILSVNRTIPSQITFTSTVKNKNIKAELHYTKADFDEAVDFPFSVPKRFTQVD
ncbi:DUF4292 domain-containing protein [Mucilaginibacter sp. RS28]|uniref:DUF4292 domain-containing protein n=1 Tax=Mucilaginibacter straminoryzae TaxID=2932774 RepID=A0A9X1X973_9SPHI|nr:DUF4292 domain-containing protein [Mucilaginibacter straminoryzae]MCJ8210694.1 DUF4292 domain-containing protein [Mucilaginibacter straminoryzae]